MLVPIPRFVMSKRPYAINTDSFTVSARTASEVTVYSYSMEAVWFRKRSNGRLAVFKGKLWDSDRDLWAVEDFIARISTARYGGTPEGCWDGESVWKIEGFAQQKMFVEKVSPWLNDYPNVPSGYTGWYSMVENWSDEARGS